MDWWICLNRNIPLSNDRHTLFRCSCVTVTGTNGRQLVSGTVFSAARSPVWQIPIATQKLPVSHLGSGLPVSGGSVQASPFFVQSGWSSGKKRTAVALTNLLYRVIDPSWRQNSTAWCMLLKQDPLHGRHGKVTVQFRLLLKVIITLWGIYLFSSTPSRDAEQLK